MKKPVIFIIFSLFSYPIVFAQPFGWKDISDNLPGNTEEMGLSDLYFINENEGWITNAWKPEIYHTTDGGQTFDVQATLYKCHAIHMLNGLEGYAGGENGRVYRTTDGGNNWTVIGSIGNTLTDIHFPPTTDTGYCCGFNGKFAKIYSDNVIPVSTGGLPDDLSSVNFPQTSQEGWICGGSIIINYRNGVWGVIPQYHPSGGYNSIYMHDSLLGWATGDDGSIIHANNGWEWIEQINPDPMERTFFDVFFLDSQEGWSVGIEGIIIHTSNGGENWEIQSDELTQQSLTGVQFTNPQNGYITGQRTLLKYTEMSGVEYNRQTIEFALFPNPTCQSVRIHCSAFKTASGTVEVLTSKGKILQKKSIAEGNEIIEMNLKELASGIYLCKITIGIKFSTKILIID